MFIPILMDCAVLPMTIRQAGLSCWTLYLDESVEQDDGYAIVAGYIGTGANWRLCMHMWQNTLSTYGKTSLHLKDLRGWNTGRNKDLLNYLGLIPQLSGLTLFYIPPSRLATTTTWSKGTTAEVVTQGYLICLFNVVVIAVAGLPDDERMEADLGAAIRL